MSEEFFDKEKYDLIVKILEKAAEITAAGGGDIPITKEGGDVAVRPQKAYNKRYKDGSGACLMPVRFE